MTMRFGWIARFIAGGLAVAAPPSRSATAAPEEGGLRNARSGVRREGRSELPVRPGANIAILAGLALIPLVAGTGFASDRDLQLGPSLREAVAAILHKSDAVGLSKRS